MQGCRNHEIRDVCDHLLEGLKDQAKAAMRSAYKLAAKERRKRCENWPPGWNRNDLWLPTACGKSWRNVFASIAWGFLPRFMKAPSRGCPFRHAGAAGLMPPWLYAGWKQCCCRRRKFAASWAGGSLATGSDLRMKKVSAVLRLIRRPREMTPSAAPSTSNCEQNTVAPTHQPAFPIRQECLRVLGLSETLL